MERFYTSHVTIAVASASGAVVASLRRTRMKQSQIPIAKLCKAHDSSYRLKQMQSEHIRGTCHMITGQLSAVKSIGFIYFRVLPNNSKAPKSKTREHGEQWKNLLQFK